MTLWRLITGKGQDDHGEGAEGHILRSKERIEDSERRMNESRERMHGDVPREDARDLPKVAPEDGEPGRDQKTHRESASASVSRDNKSPG
jgi:hypothetical protein